MLSTRLASKIRRMSVLERAAQAALAVQQADELRDKLLAERRALFLEAVSEGVEVSELAAVTGIKRQRCYKILDGNAKPKRRRAVVPAYVDL